MSWHLRICTLAALCAAGPALAQQAPAPAKPGEAAPAQPTEAAPAAQAPAAAEPPAAEAPATDAAPSADGAAAGPGAASTTESTPTAEPSAEGAAPDVGERTTPPPLPPAETPAPSQPSIPSPGDMEDRLGEQLPETVRIADDWAAPTPVLTLHGYMRMRGELMDTFWLGRRALDDFIADPDTPNQDTLGQGPDPFTPFRPIEARRLPGTGRAPSGLDCVDEDTKSDGTCDVSTLSFANLRLRLTPQLNLSEDVRVKMTFDVLDNVVAGDAPSSYYGSGPAPTFFADTDVPPPDSIVARRAWAEVRSRDLGELRFGRMPQEWGLGMLYNGAHGIDDDLGTDLDRVLFVTNLFGLHVLASYDFIAEGISIAGGPTGGPLEQSQLDDVDQLTFSVARRLSQEQIESDHERGNLMLQGGMQLTIRNQDSVPYDPGDDELSPITESEASTNTWDLWGQLRYRWLRVELEAAWRTGSMDRLALDDTGELTHPGGSVDIDSLGYALETEIRLVDEKLGLYFDHGLATGDSSVEGLSWNTDYVTQLDDDDTISTFRFHPNYKVDMILWRNVMRQVTGAYYFKPGISYDFVRSEFGQLFGARLDFIWSRASAPLQTWGNSENLGIELNVSLYFQTEDGPDLSDGFHSLLQYGVLFPMRGLGYVHEDLDMDSAQNLRLLLGVKF